jgi:hypothetical protein
MILGIDMGFWYGMALTAAITFAATLFAWLIPPKKK